MFVHFHSRAAKKKFLNFKFYHSTWNKKHKSEKQQPSAMSSAIHLTS